MNILAVCAHPDDIELNVGGTLLKYSKQGHKIFIALTTSGNTGSNVMTDVKEIERTREAEMLQSAALYDAEVRFLRNDDERLLDTNETRTQVLDAMRWARFASNVAVLAYVAKASGLGRLHLDNEDYPHSRQYYYDAKLDGPSYEDVCRKARRRGAEMGRGQIHVGGCVAGL